jgi:hypothetical protein
LGLDWDMLQTKQKFEFVSIFWTQPHVPRSSTVGDERSRAGMSATNAKNCARRESPTTSGSGSATASDSGKGQNVVQKKRRLGGELGMSVQVRDLVAIES